MKILKILLLILILFFLTIVETSWQVVPDSLSLVFIFVIIQLFKNKHKQDSLYPWLGVFLGGFFLDIYSILPDGLYIVSFSITAIILYKFILSEFGISDHFHVFFVALVTAIIFEITIILLVNLLFWIKISEVNINFSFLYTISFAILNSLSIFLLYGWNLRYKIKR